MSGERGYLLRISFTSSVVSRRSFWPSAPHGRVPTDVVVVKTVIHCMAASDCEGVSCRRAPQCDLRDPGRGDPGFRRCWVVCFAGHLRKILLCGFVFLLCFMRKIF